MVIQELWQVEDLPGVSGIEGCNKVLRNSVKVVAVLVDYYLSSTPFFEEVIEIPNEVIVCYDKSENLGSITI